MVKKMFFAAFLALAASGLYAQSGELKVKFSGYVKADYWLDSRKGTEGIDGLFIYYPMAPDYDANGKDINSMATANGTALSTRVRSNITGLEVFGAKASAIIEADFTGTTEVALLRLRLANVSFAWEKSTLLVGQAWHPLTIPQFLPRVLSLNTGAPFQCFNRNPQITYTYNFGEGFKGLASLNWQSSFESLGPNGKSSTYLRNAVLPNLDFQVSKSFGGSTIGLAYDFKMLRPNVYNTNATGQKYVNENTVSSNALLAYYNYTSSKLFVLAKHIYGENMTEHLMQGGYGVSYIDIATGVQEYSPSKGNASLINIVYGEKYRIGGIIGYLTNDGFTKKHISTIYARSEKLKSLLRIAPSFTYNYKNLILGCELEYNRASWGTADLADYGKVKNEKAVDGFRFLTSLQYNF